MSVGDLELLEATLEEDDSWFLELLELTLEEDNSCFWELLEIS
jgi:hypothetical protein